MCIDMCVDVCNNIYIDVYIDIKRIQLSTLERCADHMNAAGHRACHSANTAHLVFILLILVLTLFSYDI